MFGQILSIRNRICENKKMMCSSPGFLDTSEEQKKGANIFTVGCVSYHISAIVLYGTTTTTAKKIVGKCMMMMKNGQNGWSASFKNGIMPCLIVLDKNS